MWNGPSWPRFGLYSYGLCSYGLYRYGLYSHGLYSCGLWNTKRDVERFELAALRPKVDVVPREMLLDRRSPALHPAP